MVLECIIVDEIFDWVILGLTALKSHDIRYVGNDLIELQN